MLTDKDNILCSTVGKDFGPFLWFVKSSIESMSIIGIGEVSNFGRLDIIDIRCGLIIFPTFPKPCISIGEYTKDAQRIKIPILASLYHWGRGRLSKDSQVASYEAVSGTAAVAVAVAAAPWTKKKAPP
jgi:hypothetical protein